MKSSPPSHSNSIPSRTLNNKEKINNNSIYKDKKDMDDVDYRRILPVLFFEYLSLSIARTLFPGNYYSWINLF